MTRSLLLACAALTLLGGCGVLNRSRPVTPVVGERIPVLSRESDIAVDPDLASAPIVLPGAVANAEWAQAGGNATKVMGHLALGAQPTQAFSVSIGEGSSVAGRLASPPVVAGGRVYTIDTTATVRAFDATSGATVWSTQVGADPANRASLYGGGVAYANGRIYATNGLGYAAALDAGNGGIVWSVRPGGPLRGAPMVADGAVYVVSQDNQLYSLKESDGTTNWSSTAALEIAGVFGTASPSYAQGTVVAGFSSGELNAYRYENGRAVWQEALERTSISTSVSSLSDIDAHPVIEGGVVYALGQGGRMVALELISGQRQWELNMAGISTPWVAGEWLFVVTDDAKLAAVQRLTGRIKWITELRRYRNERSKNGPITYYGPVLAGDRLVLTSSEGAVLYADPQTGAVQGQSSIGERISLPPVVANSTLYLLDDRGRLIALR